MRKRIEMFSNKNRCFIRVSFFTQQLFVKHKRDSLILLELEGATLNKTVIALLSVSSKSTVFEIF